MSKIATKSFKVFNAKQFVKSFTNDDSSLYLFIGRSRQWEDENYPPELLDKPDFYNSLDDIIALKRISSSDIKHVIPRVEWTPGIIVNEYDDLDNDLFSKSFYVKNSNNDVYKCISNNYGSISTQEPTSRGLNYFTTSDNYKWKYMYTIDSNDQLRFETRDYMPINLNYEVMNSSVNGSIENFKLLNLGSGYSNLANLKVTVVGNGSNANVTPIITSQRFSGLNIINPGTNYNYAKVVVTEGGGSGANIRAIMSPYGGHGKDPIDELGGYRVVINTRLDFDEGSGDFPITNDYRIIGIIESPISTNTNSTANLLTLDATKTLNVAPLSGTFENDEFILGLTSKANAQIVQKGSGARFDIKYIQNKDTSNGHINFQVGDTIIGSSSFATAYVHGITQPEVFKYSGKVLYLENRRKITRAVDQAENIHIIIEF